MEQARTTVPLIITTLGALVVIIALTVAGWVVIGNLNNQTQDEDYFQTLEVALEVSRYSSSLAATGAVESNASMTRESVIASRNSIAEDKAEIEQLLASLTGKGYDDRVSRISGHVDLLIANVDMVEEGRPNLLLAMLAGEQNRQRLATATTRQLIPAIAGSLDDQFYFIVAGRSDSRDGESAQADALTEEEFTRHTHMSDLMSSVIVGHSYLSIASRMNDPTLVTNVEEAFGSTAHRMERSIEYLTENGGPDLNPRVIPLSQQLIDAGSGEGNYFDALRTRLGMAVRERELIAANEGLLDNLQKEIDAFVQDIQGNYSSSQNDSEQAASTGRTIVLVIGIVGAAAALAATGYFAYRNRRK